MFHRRAHKIINVCLTLCVIGFLVVFLKTPSISLDDTSFPSFDEAQWRDLNRKAVSENGSVGNASLSSVGDLAAWNLKGIGIGNVSITGREIVKSINFLNNNFEILNVDKFGPIDNVETVIVIQVHNRIAYLEYLVESLKDTKHIEKTLLVFSHDINVSVINQIVMNITFARVYQIFYPLNMQLFPSIFPGQDPKDCPERITKQEAIDSGCQNFASPDKYGNYRRAQLTQIKHHWWWKMNFVFDGIIDRFRLNSAWILLLEEDHFVAPDALHVLDKITANREKLCAECEIISLGTYLKSYAKYGADINHLGAHPWFSSKHNMGMALKQDTWNKIKNCSEFFCDWDDYNWDWSVMQVTVKCLPKRFKTLFAKSPRVLHIGDCGVHTHRCTAHNAYAAAKDLFNLHKSVLFPEEMIVSDTSRRSLKPSKENGGWGDVRDRALCRLNARPLDWDSMDEAGNVLDGLLNSVVAVPPVAVQGRPASIHNGFG